MQVDCVNLSLTSKESKEMKQKNWPRERPPNLLHVKQGSTGAMHNMVLSIIVCFLQLIWVLSSIYCILFAVNMPVQLIPLCSIRFN